MTNEGVSTAFSDFLSIYEKTKNRVKNLYCAMKGTFKIIGKSTRELVGWEPLFYQLNLRLEMKFWERFLANEVFTVP